MNMFNWFMVAMKQYAVFSGRARRREYWYFVFTMLLIGLMLGIALGVVAVLVQLEPAMLANIFSILFFLGLLIPSIAVFVRRLHDTNRSAWWILIGIVPIIGGIVLFVFVVLDGTPGENRYGPDPKGRTAMNEVGASSQA